MRMKRGHDGDGGGDNNEGDADSDDDNDDDDDGDADVNSDDSDDVNNSNLRLHWLGAVLPMGMSSQRRRTNDEIIKKIQNLDFIKHLVYIGPAGPFLTQGAIYTWAKPSKAQ